MIDIIKNKKSVSYIGMLIGAIMMIGIPIVFEETSTLTMVGFMILIVSTIVYVAERFKEEHIDVEEELLEERDERLVLVKTKAYALAGKATIGIVGLLFIISQIVEIELSFVFIVLIFSYFQMHRITYSYLSGEKANMYKDIIWAIIMSLYFILSFVIEFNHFKALVIIFAVGIISELIIKKLIKLEALWLK